MRYPALVTDDDGTIADDGVVDQPTLAALERLRSGARHVILLTSVPIPKLVALKSGRNRDTSCLFSVACLSPAFVAKCDELRGQDTSRDLNDLQRVMRRLDLFDLVVVENGALLPRRTSCVIDR